MINSSKPFRILFVCTGNICRSPTAEYVLKDLLVKKKIDSSQVMVGSRGTSSFHNGESADPRAIAYALTRGVDMRSHVVRGITNQDVVDFDLILCADYEHVTQVTAMVSMMPPQFAKKIKLFLRTYAPALAKKRITNVPDPYYGEDGQFAYVYDLILEGCEGLLDVIIDDISATSDKKNIK